MKPDARQYAESLSAAYEAGGKAAHLVQNLTGLLVKKGQQSLLPKIIRTLVNLEQEKAGTVAVVIETASQSDATTKKLLVAEAEKLFQPKKIVPEFVITPELVQGFRIRGGGQEVDMSAQATLKKLTRTLTSI